MNSLVVSTAVRVVNRVHGNTGNVWVQLTAGLGLVVRSTCRSHWHLVSAVACEHTDGGSAVGWKFLERTRWHTDTTHVADTGFAHAGVASGAGALALALWGEG